MKPAKKVVPVFFSREIYSPEAVKLAAAVFEGRAGVRILKAAGGVMVEVLGGENAAGEFRPAFSAQDFANEVLNQQCRIDLGLKNFRIASLISTKALLSAAGAEQNGTIQNQEKAVGRKAEKPDL